MRKSEQQAVSDWLVHAFRVTRPMPREPVAYGSLQEAVYFLRITSKLSLNEMGIRLGVTGGTIAQFETSIKYSNFSLDTLVRLRAMAKEFYLQNMVEYVNLLMIQTRNRTSPGNPRGKARLSRIGD